MKIAYVASVGPKVDGVYKKIKMQGAAWRAAGHDVEYFVSGPDKNALPDVFSVWRRFNLVNPQIERLAAIVRYKPDVLYMREETFCLFILLLFFFFPRKFVYEVNSSYQREGKLKAKENLTQLRVYKVNCFIFQLVYKFALGLVLVTQELCQSSEFKNARNKAVVPNSIDISSIQARKNPSSLSPIRLLFLGSPNQAWHGLDKLVLLARKLGAGYEVHIVGPSPGEVAAYSPPVNVVAHGYLDNYTVLLKEAHVAVGTLALHRMDMHEACPLKTREYLASGLPIILAYKDTAFENAEFPFVLQLPNSEDLFTHDENVEAVKAFCERCVAVRVERADIEHCIGAIFLEKKRLSYIEQWVD